MGALRPERFSSTFSPCRQRRLFGLRHRATAEPIAGASSTVVRALFVAPCAWLASNHRRFCPRPNPALDLAPFGRWTLRDEAAQRRSALRWASQS